jgi:hypothetical protein
VSFLPCGGEADPRPLFRDEVRISGTVPPLLYTFVAYTGRAETDFNEIGCQAVQKTHLVIMLFGKCCTCTFFS